MNALIRHRDTDLGNDKIKPTATFPHTVVERSKYRYLTSTSSAHTIYNVLYR